MGRLQKRSAADGRAWEFLQQIQAAERALGVAGTTFNRLWEREYPSDRVIDIPVTRRMVARIVKEIRRIQRG